MTRGPCDLMSDSLSSVTAAYLPFFKGWLMLSPRANIGTNWPPPPFFLPVSHSLYLCLHICVFFLSLPLVIGAHSFSAKSPLFFPSHLLSDISLLSIFSLLPPFFSSLLFAWCSAGEPQGREIIQTLCILQALWSAVEPRCSDTFVYLD